MRTRPLQFAVILSASAGLLWGQAASAADEASPAPAASISAPAPAATPAPAAAPTPASATTPAAPAAATATQGAAPKVTIQGAQANGSGVTRSNNTFSVDFPDEDIRTILRNVADLSDLNLVIPDTLQGKSSIKLRDVTWQQIFQVVLTPVGFTYVRDGNIIKVVSLQSLQQEPVTTEVFTLNYARAQDIERVVSSLVDTSAGGKIVVDSRTNSLVISERPSHMNKIRVIIDKLDKATDQVMIESKFVEVTSSDIKNIGVNWSSLNGMKIGAGNLSQSFTRTHGQTGSDGYNNNSATTNGTNNSTTNSTTSGANSLVQTGSQTIVQTTTNPITGDISTSVAQVPQNTNTQGTTSSTSTGVTGTTTAGTNSTFNLLNSLANTTDISRVTTAVFSASDFNLVLSALKTLNHVKIVSNPTVVTLNNTEANIQVGEQFPVPRYTYNQERGSFEVSGFTYKPIGIILRVTPQVNAQGFIKLTLHPEVSQQNGTTTFGGAGGAQIPIIATRSAETQVSMKDGYTMAIGGLMRTQTINGGTRVPVLGDIPLLGRLFRSDSKDREITNLIIFITAKTINAEGAPPEDVISPQQLQGLGLQRDELPGYREKTDPFLPAKPSKPNASAKTM